MGFNKRIAELEWEKWKLEEETLLRSTGASEDLIQQLREADWEMFKSNRNFYDHSDSEIWLEDIPGERCETEWTQPIRNTADLLDEIENELLHKALLEIDSISLEVLYYRIEGYSGKEIGHMLGISETAVKLRLHRIKNKIMNIL